MNVKFKRLIALSLLCAGLGAAAETVDGLIVSADGFEQSFAISEVKEVTFSDDGLTVVKTDEATMLFGEPWQMRFGQVETSGIHTVSHSEASKVKVFDLEGRLISEFAGLSALVLDKLPKGVFIIKCNGKSLKIVR